MKFWSLATAATVIMASSSANAALIERLGGQAYYDTVTELTWLSNANLAGTAMDWHTAMNWVSNLEIDGITGWVLPVTIQPDASCSHHSTNNSYYGYGCSSPLATMFEDVLGGTPHTSINDSHNSNYDLFTGIQGQANGSPYWSSTELEGNSLVAWANFFDTGTQGLHFKSNTGYAWAVYEGDVVSVSSVPVPAAIWLFCSGLIGLAGFARRKKA